MLTQLHQPVMEKPDLLDGVALVDADRLLYNEDLLEDILDEYDERETNP